MIEFHQVHKRYGRHVALDNVTLEVPEASVFGLIGPNGAGKTTALRLMAGLMRPTAGRVALKDGIRVGYLPQRATFNNLATPLETLTLFARIRRLPSTDVARAIDAAGLMNDADRQMRTLSGGMRQRVALAVACLGEPRVLLLDEPAAGLDPRAAIELRATVRRLAASGCTVVISSHSMPELEAVCDCMAMLVEGRVAAEGSVAELKARTPDGSLDRLFMEASS